MRDRKKLIIQTGCVLTLSLAGCAGIKDRLLQGADYWQRMEISDMAYRDVPVLQAMLERDISLCVTELKKAERMKRLRRATPADNPHQSESATELAEWDSPDREGYLYNEQNQFTDFETCMHTKGWERTDALPEETSRDSRRSYYQGVQEKRPKPNPRNKSYLNY